MNLPSVNDYKLTEMYLEHSPAEVKSAYGRIATFSQEIIGSIDVLPLLIEHYAETARPVKLNLLIDQLPSKLLWFADGLRRLADYGRYDEIKELVRQWRSQIELSGMMFNTKCVACGFVYDPDVPEFTCDECQQVRGIIQIETANLSDNDKLALGASVDFETAVKYMQSQFKTQDKNAVMDALPRLAEMGNKLTTNHFQSKWLQEAVEFTMNIGDWVSFNVIIQDYHLALHSDDRLRICGGRLGHCTECGFLYKGLYLNDWTCADCGHVRRLCNRQDILDNGRCPSHNGRVNPTAVDTALYTFRDQRFGEIYEQVMAHDKLRDIGSQMALLISRVQELHSKNGTIDLVALTTEIDRRFRKIERLVKSATKHIKNGEVQPALDKIDSVVLALGMIREAGQAGQDEQERWDEIRQTLDLYRKFRDTEQRIQVSEKQIITFNYLTSALFTFAEMAVQRMKPLLQEEQINTVKVLLLRDVENIIDGEIHE